MKRILHSSTFAFLITAILCSPAELIALNKTETLLKQQSSKTGFIENKGQVIDQHNKPNPAVLYLLNTPGMNVQLRSSGWSYDVYKVESSDTLPFAFRHSPFASEKMSNHTDSEQRKANSYRFHRIDFDLQNINPGYAIETGVPSSDYLNYYTTGTPVEGATFVRYFDVVTYKNIYPLVDLQFSADQKSGFKYTFVVHAGGDLDAIRIRISGAETEIAVSGSLILRTARGLLEEAIPESYYQSKDGNIKIPVTFRRIDDDIFGFTPSISIPSGVCFFVDPVPIRLWGTYYGGNGNADFLGSVIRDNLGNIIVGGQTNSINNIASSGGHQTIYGGNQDLLLAKFDSAGMRIWGTFYGGSDAEYGGNCAVDKAGCIYLCGQTLSDNNITTPGCHQPVRGGNDDAFLAKFNANGVRLWGTYYGGSLPETGSTCATDPHGDVYIIGATGSINQISTPGSYQEIKDNLADGYLVKFDSAGTRQWGTYYGSNGKDNPSVLSISDSGIIYFGGQTTSQSGLASPGSFQPVFGGASDGFLVAFDTSGQRIWATYYGGNGDDCIVSIDASVAGVVYFTGFTRSTDNIASPGAFQSTFQGATDGMVVKFNADGTRQWGSYYGGTGTEYIPGCKVSNTGDLFIAGYTDSGNGISTPDAYQPSFSGMVDGFLAKFDPAGQLVWGTYYGGSSTVNFDAVCTDPYGDVYVCGLTDCATNMATPGAWQTNINVPDDGLLVKFRYCDIPARPGPINGATGICIPSDSVVYSISPVPFATGYIWTVPAGASILSGQNTSAIMVNFSAAASPGPVTVTGTNDCGVGITDTLFISIFQHASPDIRGDTSGCTGTQGSYFTNGGKSAYQWDISTGGTVVAGGTNTSDSIVILWNLQGSQWVKISFTDTTACKSDTTVLDVGINDSYPVSVSISPSANPVCKGDYVTLTAIPFNGGLSPLYQWKVNGINAGTNFPVYTYTPAGNDEVICLMTTSYNCVLNNPASDTLLITQKVESKAIDTTLCYGVPYFTEGAWQTTAGIYHDTLVPPVNCIGFIQTNLKYKPVIPVDLGADTLLCDNLIALSAYIPGGTYLWQDGSTDSVFVAYVPGEFRVTVSYDGCSVSDSINIGECDVELWFPNAFTPNGDGLNDTYHPKGLGVEKFSIKIFNRWGEMVFETTSLEPGWDGTCNRNPCPEGTYVFIAFYQGRSGGQVQAKGTIILER